MAQAFYHTGVLLYFCFSILFVFHDKSPQTSLNKPPSNHSLSPHSLHQTPIYAMRLDIYNRVQDAHEWSLPQMLFYPFGGAADAEMDEFVYEHNDIMRGVGEKMTRVCEELVYQSNTFGVFRHYFSPTDVKHRRQFILKTAQTTSIKSGEWKHNVASATVSAIGGLISGDIYTPLAYAANAAALWMDAYETQNRGRSPQTHQMDKDGHRIFGEMTRQCRKYEDAALKYDAETLYVYYDISPQLVLYMSMENMLANIRMMEEANGGKGEGWEGTGDGGSAMDAIAMSSLIQKTEYFLDILGESIFENTDTNSGVNRCRWLRAPTRCIQKHFDRVYDKRERSAARASAAFPRDNTMRDHSRRIADEYLDIIRQKMRTDREITRVQYDRYVDTIRMNAETAAGAFHEKYIASILRTGTKMVVWTLAAPFDILGLWGEWNKWAIIACLGGICVWGVVICRCFYRSRIKYG